MADSIQDKFDNFKRFVVQISKNKQTVKEYENMSWFKLQALALGLLVPNRHQLDEIIPEMQKRLDFEDQHRDKFRRYIELFIEYLAGEQAVKPPDYITGTMPFEERMKKYMEAQNM